MRVLAEQLAELHQQEQGVGKVRAQAQSALGRAPHWHHTGAVQCAEPSTWAVPSRCYRIQMPTCSSCSVCCWPLQELDEAQRRLSYLSDACKVCWGLC